VGFVLFLNKLDILDSKLKSGIQFGQYVTSYVNKPNEVMPVSKRAYSPVPYSRIAGSLQDTLSRPDGRLSGHSPRVLAKKTEATPTSDMCRSMSARVSSLGFYQ